MLTAEEKANCISRIISLPVETIDQVTVQQRLHELLLRDTIDGKLYKYRSFDDKGYSLKNLENGTLHCSSPALFNDPFDCKIGVTFQSLYTAKYGTELDLICDILRKFVLTVQREIAIADCNEDEQRIICQLMKCEHLMHFVNEDRFSILSEDELSSVLKTNPLIFLELIQTVLEDQKFSSSLGIVASMLPRMLASISEEGMLQLAKDNCTIEDFARANGITVDADEIDLTMLVSNQINPDLAPAAADIQRLIDDWDSKISHSTIELFLIGCLCTNSKNRLMWSHYADSHKGFCIEFDFSEPTKEVLETLPLPVVYSDKRPLIPWEAAFEKTTEKMESACRELMLGLLIKDSEWSYENEWRIIINAANPADLKMPRISCVYLGASIAEKNREKILEIAKQNKIPVKQMKVDRGAYALHTEDILTF